MAIAGETEQESIARELAAFLSDTSSLPDPYPLYHRLRAVEPVHRSLLGFWVVTSYAAAEEVFRHAELSRAASAQRQYGPLLTGAVSPDAAAAVEMFLSTFLFRDEPDHTRLRRLVARAFTPRAVAAWRARVEAICDRLVSAAEEKDRFDFLTEIAYPLPEAVICELLGVPVGDHELFRTWTAEMSHGVVVTGPTSRETTEREAIRRRAGQACAEYADYLRDLVRERRGRSRGDLVSLLVEAEESGDRLDTDELIGTLMVLISAGHETTANILGNGMLALLRHPDQFALLRSDPSRAPAALEELFRYDTPSRSQPRVARRDTVIAGTTIPAGDAVTVLINAANRDPARFPHPDLLDITRDASGHLAFGAGIHYCVGAALARLEAQVAFATIARRLGDLELAGGELAWRPSFLRSLASLPVARGARK